MTLISILRRTSGTAHRRARLRPCLLYSGMYWIYELPAYVSSGWGDEGVMGYGEWVSKVRGDSQ